MPTLATVKALSLTDLAIMSYSSHLLRKRLTSYFNIDCFTVPDPFSEENEFNYFIVVDKANTNRIISPHEIDHIDFIETDSYR